MVENTFNLGDIVRVKVGKNLVETEITGIMPDGLYRVKSVNTHREFSVRHIHELVTAATRNIPDVAPASEVEAVAEPDATEMPCALDAETEDADQREEGTASDSKEDEYAINPAHESDRPRRRMSLMSAAVEVLKKSNVPMNTREIVAAVISQGLWEQTDCKTPEQSLYGSIFREIAAKDHPRIVRAEQKGKFRIAE